MQAFVASFLPSLDRQAPVTRVEFRKRCLPNKSPAGPRTIPRSNTDRIPVTTAPPDRSGSAEIGMAARLDVRPEVLQRARPSVRPKRGTVADGLPDRVAKLRDRAPEEL